jgi:aspartate racemase
MSEKIIGILGGMGPQATIDLFTKIVKETKAHRDQDHLRILIDNNPKIPDRTLALQGKAPNPLSQLVRSARILENAGAGFIIIPCMTAHYYYDALQRHIKIPILHMLEITAQHIRTKLKGISKVGLLGTTGAIKTELFQKAFSPTGLELILPDPEVQEKWIMAAIYGRSGIKAIGPSENSKHLLIEASEMLIKRGAQAIIAGCTEIPLVLKEDDLSVPVIDPTSILAQATIQKARRGSRRRS